MTEFEPTIKISKRTPVNKPSPSSNKTGQAAGFGKQVIDKVSLSQTSKVQASLKSKNGSASEIRQDLVNKFRKVLDKGTYEIKADEIADKIVQKIKENKNSFII